MKKQEVHGWIIVGNYGAYVDYKNTRSEMIKHHTDALGKSWKYCRKKGDRCVKAVITYTNPTH